jgi:MraZ protein
MQRHFFAGAAQGELDRQGRLVLPAALIEHAALGREVTVAGVYDHLEIWDRAKWREQLQQVEGSAEDVAERLAN